MDKFFKLKENGTTVKTEILAGITTFLTVAYIIVVNPTVLGDAGLPFNGVLTATVLVSCISSVLMGLVANLPFVIAPGMGINAFFTYSIVVGMGVSPYVALGCIFISGLCLTVFSLLRFSEYVIDAVPMNIKYAIGSGIGLFLSLIGFKSVGFIVGSPATLVTFGGMNYVTSLFVLGLVFTSYLVLKKIKGALMIGIIVVSLIAYLFHIFLGVDAFYPKTADGTYLVPTLTSIVSMPSFEVFGKFNIAGALTASMIMPIFSLFFIDYFDSISSFVGLSEVAGFVDEETKRTKNITKALCIDGISSITASICGTSSGVTYIESISGIEEGGKTGLTAIVTGLLFLPFMFLSPLLNFIPEVATAPILVLVGIFMIAPCLKIDWNDLEQSIPSFLAFVLIPFTFSISQGIIWSMLSHTIIKISHNKINEIHPATWVINILCLIAIF